MVGVHKTSLSPTRTVMFPSLAAQILYCKVAVNLTDVLFDFVRTNHSCTSYDVGVPNVW